MTSTHNRRRTVRFPNSLGAVVAVFLTLSGLFLAGMTLGLAPEPDPIPRRWQLTIEPGPLRIATVDVPNVGPRSYFYLTYKVTNASGGDLLFAPSFELATNTGDVVHSGRDVPASVTKALMDSLGNPYLEDQISIVGTLLQGEGNAKEGIVVWPAGSLRLTQLEVYAAGFSGETKAVEIQDPQTGKTVKATVRKTLQIRYQPPGVIRDQGSKPFEVIEQRWVMR
jgi:hypothetical protein